MNTEAGPPASLAKPASVTARSPSLGRLVARTVPVATLPAFTRETMWRLFERHYLDVDRSRFERDLHGKQHVILLSDVADGTLQGFSTLEVYARTFEGRELAVVYSGDTIITPGYWGQTALGVAFVRFVLGCKLRRPLVPLYWFLISKGYKTFFLLSHNFPEYWPRHDRPTPPRAAALLAFLAADKFGSAFIPARGILHFDPPAGRLRAGIAPIEPALLGDPDVRLFVEKNPGHEQGDELCCVGRIDLRMGLHYLTRLVRRRVRSLVRAPAA